MDYRVDQLASRAGITVDTVRYYQSKGLLPPPRREGRVALYSGAHLERLRRIRALAARGLSLALIQRVLGARRSGADDELMSAVIQEEENVRFMSREELAAETGVPPALLSSIEAAGLIAPSGAPDGSPRYTETDVRIIKGGLALLEFGFPIDEILDLARSHHRAMRDTVDRAIGLFDRCVREPGGSAADDRVADAFLQLLPAVTDLVANHFQRLLLTKALRRLENVGDEEGLAVAAAQNIPARGGASWKG
jgi:DNA-binding transcriptional MerR regulator